MPTVFSHSAIAYAGSKIATEGTASKSRIVLTAMALAALPDADALFVSVIPYGHPLGHRGLTHSLLFAVVIAMSVALVFSKAGWATQHPFWRLALLFVLVTASHGFFDAMTDGGLGVAFFAPFTNNRYFFPWRPIPVAPLSLERLMTPQGWQIFRAEAGLFWIFVLGAAIWDRRTRWRTVAAGVCAILGIIVWIIALSG